MLNHFHLNVFPTGLDLQQPNPLAQPLIV